MPRTTPAWIDSPDSAFQYAQTNALRDPELEELIATDPYYAYLYAVRLVRGRWPLGEPAILSDSCYRRSYIEYLRDEHPDDYAQFQLEHGAWVPSVEESVRAPTREEFTRPGDALDYVLNVINNETTYSEVMKRCPPLEPTILKDPGTAYQYAAHVIRGRWPEGEPVIAKDASNSYSYAKMVIRGRWPEGEAAMAQDPSFAYWYADDVLNGRFQAGESSMRTCTNGIWRKTYLRMLQLKDPEGYAEFQLEYGDWVPEDVAEAALVLARKA